MKQHEHLNGYRARTPRPDYPTVVNARNAAVPTIDTLAGAPSPLLDSITHWHELNSTIADHQRKEAQAARDAETATTTYRAKVRDAINAGNDPSKINDETGKYRAIASAHRDFAKTASGQLERHGHTLGALLAEHAEAISDIADHRLEAAATRVHVALKALNDTWEEWAAAFGLRMWASDLAFGVATVPAFHGSDRYRKRADDAAEPIRTLLAEPDKLRHDERVVNEWRTQEAAAAAWSTKNHAS